MEEVAERIEITLKENTDAVRCEWSLGKIAVVGFAIGFETDAARRGEQQTHIEVSHKVVGVGGLVAITEVAVD